MNPNQPPNYPPGQYPPQYPPMYPTMAPGQQNPYMAQGTPQYPQPTVPVPQQQHPYMNVQIKQEPVWSQDGRYGMPPSVPPSMPQYPPAFPMPGMPMARPEDVAPSPMPYSTYVQQQMAPANPGTSLLAQHLVAAPAPPHVSQPLVVPQPSQLHQLLQQPVYPPAGQQGSTSNQQAAQQMQQQQLAEQQRQAQMQAQLRQQQQAQQAQQQAQQQYQADSVPSQHKNSFLSAEQAGHAFPPSASSTQSAYQGNQDQPTGSQMMMPPRPPSIPNPETREDFEKLSTGDLCTLGRELVTDLTSKTSQLSQMLKKVMERKTLSQGENPNDLSDACQSNLEKMSEIRQVIEQRRAPGYKRMSGEDYLILMLEDQELDDKQLERRAELEKRIPAYRSETAPNEGDVWYEGRWIPEELHRKYLLFEENKRKLVGLANQLKMLQWKIEVTSPGHLKKVDQTKISKKREEPG